MSTNDPLEEPDAGPAEGGAVGDTEQAENAEAVLDPDAEGTGAGEEAAAQAERIEDR